MWKQLDGRQRHFAFGGSILQRQPSPSTQQPTQLWESSTLTWVQTGAVHSTCGSTGKDTAGLKTHANRVQKHVLWDQVGVISLYIKSVLQRMLFKWKVSQKVTKIIEGLENKVCKGKKNSSTADIKARDCVEKIIQSSKVKVQREQGGRENRKLRAEGSSFFNRVHTYRIA